MLNIQLNILILPPSHRILNSGLGAVFMLNFHLHMTILPFSHIIGDL